MFVNRIVHDARAPLLTGNATSARHTRVDRDGTDASRLEPSEPFTGVVTPYGTSPAHCRPASMNPREGDVAQVAHGTVRVPVLVAGHEALAAGERRLLVAAHASLGHAEEQLERHALPVSRRPVEHELVEVRSDRP